MRHFLNLPELDLTPFKKGGRKILESFNVEQLCGYQVLKQADVVMLLSSMPDLFPEDIILKIINIMKRVVFTIHP